MTEKASMCVAYNSTLIKYEKLEYALFGVDMYS